MLVYIATQGRNPSARQDCAVVCRNVAKEFAVLRVARPAVRVRAAATLRRVRESLTSA